MEQPVPPVSPPDPDGALRVESGYEPPELRVLGTLAQLTQGIVGASDGLGPGSALT